MNVIQAILTSANATKNYIDNNKNQWVRNYLDEYGLRESDFDKNIINEIIEKYCERNGIVGNITTDDINMAIETYIKENANTINGKDGFSPTIATVKHEDSYIITVTDKNGSYEIKIKDGVIPVRGVDYFTEEDVRRIKEEIKNETPKSSMRVIDGVLIMQTNINSDNDLDNDNSNDTSNSDTIIETE